MTIRVFISYSSEDEALHSALSTAINQSDSARHELNLSLGKSLADGLRSQIDECDVCVFLATRRSLKSPWCLAELGAFWGAGKRVIIYLADPSIKQTDLPPQFANDLWTKDSKELIKDIQRTDSHIVQRTSEGYCTSIGRMNIKVKMGRIEDVDCSDESCMIALP